MIDLDAVIRHFGPLAVNEQLADEETDREALKALRDKTEPDSSRTAKIGKWLSEYKVVLFFTPSQRDSAADAVLKWADQCDVNRDLNSADALAQAHRELTEQCANVHPTKKDLASLASKALWLCYPDSVPIFDGNAKCALYVVSKLEGNVVPLRGKESEYHQFVHVWKALYQRYAAALDSLDMKNYPYRVRIFDRILWFIGEPKYGR